jgi:hypothetical protein
MLREVNLTTARNLSPLFDEAVRREHPVVIVRGLRGRRERGLLLSRDALVRILAPYRFRVDVLPEAGGGFTLWLRELDVGGSGSTLRTARQNLLSAVRAYVRDYLEHLELYRHLPDLGAREPYVLRLSLAEDDAELLELLVGARAPDQAAAAERAGDPRPGVPPTGPAAG